MSNQKQDQIKSLHSAGLHKYLMLHLKTLFLVGRLYSNIFVVQALCESSESFFFFSFFSVEMPISVVTIFAYISGTVETGL